MDVHPLKMVLIGIDPSPYVYIIYLYIYVSVYTNILVSDMMDVTSQLSYRMKVGTSCICICVFQTGMDRKLGNKKKDKKKDYVRAVSHADISGT